MCQYFQEEIEFAHKFVDMKLKLSVKNCRIISFLLLLVTLENMVLFFVIDIKSIFYITARKYSIKLCHEDNCEGK